MAQIILVMIWVVLPSAGEEYCCIHKVFVETVSTAIWASLGAGDRVVLLDTVTVLIKPYLQATQEVLVPTTKR